MEKLLDNTFLLNEFHNNWKILDYILIFSINKIFCIFFWRIWPKKQNCLFKIKLGIYTNLNMLNLMVMFTFSVLDWKYPFWANLVENTKTVCLRWNLNARLIPVWWIRKWCSLFFVSDWNYPFWSNLVQKLKLFVEEETWCLDKLKYAEFGVDVYLPGFGQEIDFFGKVGPKNKNCFFNIKIGT